MKLVMTLLVRDAEHLLRENLEFHLRQGVDYFIITDNRSVDGTSSIIKEYVAAGLAEYIWEPDDTFSQARWVTRMARRAAAVHRADWVINSDELPSAQDKPVLLSALIVIETDDVSCRSKREYAAPKGRPWGAGRGKGLYQQGSGGDCEPQTSLPSQNRLASKSANPKAYGHVLLVRSMEKPASGVVVTLMPRRRSPSASAVGQCSSR